MTPTPHPLLSLLETQRQDAARMFDILDAELQAIKGNDLGAFEQAMDAKTRHIAHLEQQEKVFQPMLEQIVGSPAGKEQLATYIDNSGDPALQQAWTELRTVLRQCFDQNLLNQRVLEASRAEVQQALNILRGEQPCSASAGIYQETGRTDSPLAKGQPIGVV